MRGCVVTTLSSSTMITLSNAHSTHHHLLQFRLRLCFSASSTTRSHGFSFPKRFVSMPQGAYKASLVSGHSGFLCKVKSRDSEALIVEKEDDFVVVNFYCFVFIKDPLEEVSKHLSFMEVCVKLYLFNSRFSGCELELALWGLFCVVDESELVEVS